MATSDYVNIFTDEELDIPNLDGLDPSSIQAMMEEETAEVKELELHFAVLKRQEEQKKRKAVLGSLEALQAVKARKALLKRAIAGEIPASSIPSSNPVTPVTSPVKLKRQTSMTPGPSASTNKLGELPNLLNSVLQLRQGNMAPFSSIMANCTNFAQTNNLPNVNPALLNTNKLLLGQDITSSKDATNIGGGIDPPPISELNYNTNSNVAASANMSLPNGNSQLGQVQVTFKEPIVSSDNKPDAISTSKASVLINADSKHGDISLNKDDSEEKKKPKKSGIMTKPDESDIIQTVKFPHELLDDRHVKGPDKVFAKLNFTNLCAGELELITRPGISNAERDARLAILTTLCYHYNYLDVTELKAQYGATMQRIERG